MSDPRPCPVCGHPRKVGSHRKVLATCGNPFCVQISRATRLREAARLKRLAARQLAASPEGMAARLAAQEAALKRRHSTSA